MAAARSFRKIVASSLSTDFRKACEIVTSTVKPLTSSEVLIKTKYAGINATDINFSAGRYSGANPKLPLDVGLEGIGEVVEVGNDVSKEMIGKPVGYISPGSFSEYISLPAKSCMFLPTDSPEYIPLLISGLTASISLEQLGRITAGEKVLVTAAAGGTGHIAVQVAKAAGCHVIGTCSSEEKCKLLKSLGCDHVINYKEENLSSVLKETYPEGIDVIYESVGGATFEACLNRMAPKSRMIVIGFITSYDSPSGIDRHHRNATLMTKLLMKSASMCGFYLFNHPNDFKPHLKKLVTLMGESKLKTLIDTADSNGKQFIGLESAFDAVDYLYSRQSKGKVIIQTQSSSTTSKL